jgi:hypothetical protein
VQVLVGVGSVSTAIASCVSALLPRFPSVLVSLVVTCLEAQHGIRVAEQVLLMYLSGQTQQPFKVECLSSGQWAVTRGAFVGLVARESHALRISVALCVALYVFLRLNLPPYDPHVHMFCLCVRLQEAPSPLCRCRNQRLVTQAQRHLTCSRKSSSAPPTAAAAD